MGAVKVEWGRAWQVFHVFKSLLLGWCQVAAFRALSSSVRRQAHKDRVQIRSLCWSQVISLQLRRSLGS